MVILGAGESGAGAAVLAKAKGFDVFVSDKSSIKPKYKEMLDADHLRDRVCRKVYGLEDDLHHG